jgi:hypothetical protein
MSLPIGRLPTIPEYAKEYIWPGVDLISEPKQCCFIHEEEKPSFSYSRERMCWSCFGKCHLHGRDVIDMHRYKFKLNSRDEAETSLRALCKMKKAEKMNFEPERLTVNTSKVEYASRLQECIMRANTVDQWIALDYIMSQYPNDILDLNKLLNQWRDENENNGANLDIPEG